MLKKLIFGAKLRGKMDIRKEIATPPVNREMKVLDRSFFVKKFPIWSLFLKDAGNLRYFLVDCRDDILQIPGVEYIVKSSEDYGAEKNKSNKLLLLTERLTAVEDAPKVLSPLTMNLIAKYGGEFKPHELVVGYDHWKADEILKAILPPDTDEDIPSGFTRTGHIAHVNLKAEFKPYDELIGQVILDKNKSLRTVVDKTDSIATEFRTFPMKVIAGEEDFIVTQSESDCNFKFDFSKVYWNSRLHTEHSRLVKSFDANDLICDVMAGVGPFAIPAAKRHLVCFANDLNPDSYKWLNENVKLNKVGTFVKTSNTDGREFIKQSPQLIKKFSEDEKFIEIKPHQRKKKKLETPVSTKQPIAPFFSHYIMNLPDSAMTFVSSFIGLYTNLGLTKEEMYKLPNFKLPVVHVHHFEKFEHTETPSEEELYHRIHQKVKSQLQYEIPFDLLKFHLVRKVSPTKPMYCVSISLPEEVAFK